MSSLSFCSQFSNATSCCSSEMDSLLQAQSLKYYEFESKKDFFFINLLNRIESTISTCGKSSAYVSAFNSSSLTASIKSYRRLILKEIRNQVRLIRGNICALCIPPSSYSDYFDLTAPTNPKLNVEGSNLNTYLTDQTSVLNDLETLKDTFIT